MTRRLIIFQNKETGLFYSTPEFNGDKAEMEFFHSQDLCEKNWPEIIQEFKNIKTLQEFRMACDRAQGYYHSIFGNMVLPIVQLTSNAPLSEKIEDNIWVWER
jgi:hypothetical protein